MVVVVVVRTSTYKMGVCPAMMTVQWCAGTTHRELN